MQIVGYRDQRHAHHTYDAIVGETKDGLGHVPTQSTPLSETRGPPNKIFNPLTAAPATPATGVSRGCLAWEHELLGALGQLVREA